MCETASLLPSPAGDRSFERAIRRGRRSVHLQKDLRVTPRSAHELVLIQGVPQNAIDFARTARVGVTRERLQIRAVVIPFKGQNRIAKKYWLMAVGGRWSDGQERLFEKHIEVVHEEAAIACR